MTILPLLAAYAQPVPALGFHDYKIERAAARIEARCNIPITIERGPINPTVDLEASSYAGCDVLQAAEFLGQIIQPPCAYVVTVADNAAGAQYIHIGPGAMADSGGCVGVPTALDEPIDLGDREIGSVKALRSVFVSELGYKVLCEPTGHVRGDSGPSATTLRDLLNRQLVEHSDGRRVEWRTSPGPNGLTFINVTFAGGPYPTMYGHELGRYHYTTGWWIRDADSYRPLNDVEMAAISSLWRREEAGEISYEEMIEERMLIHEGTLIHSSGDDDLEHLRLREKETRRQNAERARAGRTQAP